ncbi:fluoride efflux transporter CrcB [Polymorphobacter sp. PAMC 29334]|uniref:fluoride efflux transporter CrcB n=1 Tax=Polymorphobacter sp. PAMC 29334 TaxID=2862331 RepID=UPI001C74E6CF|nr:fluoride efflux transporter CrcB [Polymorphobacter sp. PAMC 29334]QYE36856.1 fluoride efflux transporter CrcB [Polymorphobacter sp. PAMC 29334]
MPPLVLVMSGGAIGAALRYLVGLWAYQNLGAGLPFGTWAVNIIGGLAMGLLAGSLSRTNSGEPLRLLLGVGVLGGFTTFSAFSLETFNMIVRGDGLLAAAYAVSSVAGSVVALYAGVMLARA